MSGAGLPPREEAPAHDAVAELTVPTPIDMTGETVLARVSPAPLDGRGGVVMLTAWAEIVPWSRNTSYALRIRRAARAGETPPAALPEEARLDLGVSPGLRVLMVRDETPAGEPATWELTAQQWGAHGEGRVRAARLYAAVLPRELADAVLQATGRAVVAGVAP